MNYYQSTTGTILVVIRLITGVNVFKRLLYFLSIFSIFISACSCGPKGPAGYWYGYVDCLGKGHQALVIEGSDKVPYKAHLDNIEMGAIGIPFRNLVVTGKTFHGEIGADGSVDLTMEGPDIFKGTMKMTSDSLALIAGKSFPMELKRGLAYSVPRVNSQDKAVTDYSYRKPERLDDGWEPGDIQDVGGDRNKIENVVKAILKMDAPNIHSLLLARHGKLLLDEYFYGYEPTEIHQLQSTSKSVLSILMGIAADQHLLQTDDKLIKYFPKYRSKPNWDVRKNKITLGTLLSMTSGFACDDGQYRKAGGAGCEVDMLNSPDWLDFCLTQPMAHQPGQHYGYCTSCLTLLGAVLAKQSGMSVGEFAQKYLYDPLGIHSVQWLTGPNGITEVGASHWLRPRDMAKLGLLYLDKGNWNGKQVVSAKWVEESTHPQPIPPDGKPWPTFTGYGYLWWSQKIPTPRGDIFTYYANGKGGQYIIVVPDMDLVCVMTAGYYQAWSSDQGLEFFKDYIINAFS